MNYEQTLTFLLEKLPMFQRIGPAAFKKDLSNTIKLLESLDNPHQAFKCIHIGGTNGKGSVSHIMASVMEQAGYSVGIYTSPHYKDIRERIKVNRELMEQDFLVKFVEKVMPMIELIQPSYFELLVAMAFDYFKYKKIDYAIVEVGLGGRLDSTNVILPELSIITNISWDHQNLLGDTLELIAGEKAGIIKPNVPVVIGERQPEVAHVFTQKASNENAPITFGSDQGTCRAISKDLGIMEIEIAYLKNLPLLGVTDLYGDYQLKNIQTAFAATKALEGIGIIKQADALFIRAIQSVRNDWKFLGRMYFLKTAPLVLADSAHNEAGMEYLLKEIRQLAFNHLHIIYGTVSDKDPTNVMSSLPSDATFYFCKPNIPRGLNSQSLFEIGVKLGLSGSTHSSCIDAYNAALHQAKEDDLILICGSIFVVAELI